MSYILDGIILLIVIFFMVLSAKKGFVRTLIEVVGFVAAIVVAFSFSTPLANFAYDKLIQPSVFKTAEKVYAETSASAATAVDTMWEKFPKFITESKFFDVSKTDLLGSADYGYANSQEFAQSVSDNFVEPIATKLLSVLISVILVVVLLVIVRFLAKIINKAFSFSLIGNINTILGGILGIIKGGAIAVVFCLLISLILSFTKDGFLIFTSEAINSSHIFKYLMSLSPFM